MIKIIIIFILLINITLLYSLDLEPTTFDEVVLKDDRVWLIEFYSSMCGSCKEFEPIWNKIETSMKSIVTGKINVDTPAGSKLATQLGVFNEGIPNIRLYRNQLADNAISIMAGEELTAKAIIQSVRRQSTDLTRRDDGYFLKVN